MPPRGRPTDEAEHAGAFAKELHGLEQTVAITKRGVAHGYGVVATPEQLRHLESQKDGVHVLDLLPYFISIFK